MITCIHIHIHIHIDTHTDTCFYYSPFPVPRLPPLLSPPSPGTTINHDDKIYALRSSSPSPASLLRKCEARYKKELARAMDEFPSITKAFSDDPTFKSTSQTYYATTALHTVLGGGFSYLLSSSIGTMKRSGWAAHTLGTAVFTGIGAMMGFYMGSSSGFNALAREVSRDLSFNNEVEIMVSAIYF